MKENNTTFCCEIVMETLDLVRFVLILVLALWCKNLDGTLIWVVWSQDKFRKLSLIFFF